MTEPIPDEAKMRQRTWLIAGVLAAVVLLLGVGVAFAVMAARSAAPKPVASSVPSSTSTSSAATPTSSTAEATSSALTSAGASQATTSGSPTAVATSTPGQIVRSARVAYRLKGQIWVSGEDGSNARAVVGSLSDDFALSPDGRTLALMPDNPSTADRARLVDVDTGVQAMLPLAIELPAWSPDSAWVAYTANNASGGYQIRTANRDGSNDALLKSPAAAPSVSADGTKIAFTRHIQASAPGTDAVQVYDRATGSVKTVPDSAGASYFAFASGGALYFVKGGSNPSIRLADKALSKSALVSSITPSASAPSPGPLLPSPDGSKVAFTMTGDDGYSRISVADAAAHKVTSISTYGDVYPLRWTLDGSGILYIFGNAIQNQSTSMYRMRPDGSNKTLLVSGAGL